MEHGYFVHYPCHLTRDRGYYGWLILPIYCNDQYVLSSAFNLFSFQHTLTQTLPVQPTEEKALLDTISKSVIPPACI